MFCFCLHLRTLVFRRMFRQSWGYQHSIDEKGQAPVEEIVWCQPHDGQQGIKKLHIINYNPAVTKG